MKRLSKISIITVCLNSEKTIERTIRSVIKQTYKNIEYIIVDGKSTDKTLKIVKKYQNKIAKIISEKDEGIYDAMNKGILASTGEVLFFLNSDDYFCDSRVVEKIMRKFAENPSVDLIYGNSIFGRGVTKKIIDNSRKIDRKYLINNTLHHQSIFAKRAVFEKTGLFSTKYKIASDYEWVVKVFNMPQIKKLYVKQNIVKVIKFGLSSMINYEDEREETRKKYFTLYEIWSDKLIKLLQRIKIW